MNQSALIARYGYSERARKRSARALDAAARKRRLDEAEAERLALVAQADDAIRRAAELAKADADHTARLQATRDAKALAAAKAAQERHERSVAAQCDDLSDRFALITECAALWAIDPRSPAAWPLLLAVPEDVRRACLALLPWDVDPVFAIVRRREAIRGPQGERGRGGHRLEVIGQAYGVTREWIRQIEDAALESARRAVRGVDLESPAEIRPDHWEAMACM